MALPTDGLTCHLKADQLSLSDNDPVGTWTDQSSNGLSFTASGAARPTYHTNQINGQPAVTFDGTGNYMTTTASWTTVFAASAKTIFVVLNVNASADDVIWMDTAQQIHSLETVSSPSGVKHYNYSSGATQVTSNLTQDAWHAWETRHDGVSLYSQVDQGTESSSASGATGSYSSDTGFWLGNRPSGSDYFNGQIAELIIYNRVLNPQERYDARSYLSTKYGFAAPDLPPVYYKSAGAGAEASTANAALSVNCPATVDAGDILIAHAAWDDNYTDAPTTPSGWTALLDQPALTETSGRHWLFGKIADGSEDGAAISFGTAGGTSLRVGRIYSFGGRRSGTIDELVPGGSITWTSQYGGQDGQMPTVVTEATGALACAFVDVTDDTAVGNATGMTGGTWTEAVAEFATSTGTDACIQLQTCIPTDDPGKVYGGVVATAAGDEPAVIGLQILPAPANRDGPYRVREGTYAAAGAGTSITATVGARGHAVGNTLIVAVNSNHATAGANPSSLEDSRGNSYTLLHGHTAPGAGQSLAVYGCVIATGKALVTGDTITATWATSRVGSGIRVVEFANTTLTEDVASAGANAYNTSLTVGSITPPTASVLLIGAGAGNGRSYAMPPAGDTDTAGGAYWQSSTRCTGNDVTSVITKPVCIDHKVTASSAAQTYNYTLSTTYDWAAVALALQPQTGQKTISETSTGTDACSLKPGKGLADPAAATDSVGKTLVKAITDSIQGTDSPAPQLTTGATYVTVELMQGANVIATSGTITANDNAWHDGTLNLSESEAASITDYSALVLRVTGWSDGSAGPWISFAEVEVPERGVATWEQLQQDAVLGVDATTRVMPLHREIDDVALLTDGIGAAEQNAQGVADGATLTDNCDPQLTLGSQDYDQPVDDSIQGSDATVKTLSLSIADSISAADGGFDPTSIPGLVGWFDASQIDGLSDNDPVSTWEELSGNYDATGSGTTRPTYRTNQLNGLPAVQFNGNQFLESALPSDEKPFTIFAVVRCDDANQNYPNVIGSATGGGRDFGLDATGTNHRPYFSNGSTNIIGSTTVEAGTAVLIVATYGAGNDWAFYRDNDQDYGSGNTSITFQTPRTSVIGAARAPSPIVYWDGLIAELLVCDVVVTDRSEAESYLGSKWGLGFGEAAPLAKNLTHSIDDSIQGTDATAQSLSRTIADSISVADIGEGYANTVLADSPTAYWRLGESEGTTAVDEVGDNDGTYLNTPTLGVDGLVEDPDDTAVEVVAINSEEATLPGVALSTTGTIEIWFDWISSPGGDAGGAVFRDNTSSGGWGIGCAVAPNRNSVRIDGTNFDLNQNGGVTLVGSGRLHVVIVKDGSNATVYVNGVVKGSATGLTSNPSQLPWHAGHNGSNIQYQDAVLDEVAIYQGVALTEEQVIAHYEAGTSPAQPLSKNLTHSIDDAIQGTDLAGATIGKAPADSIQGTDACDPQILTQQLTQDIDDGIQGTDGIQLVEANAVTQDDAASLSDVPDRQVDSVRTPGDAAYWIDATTRAASRAQQDTAQVTDEITLAVGRVFSLEDVAQGTDQAATQTDFARTVEDGAQSADQATETAAFVRTQTDEAALSDNQQFAQPGIWMQDLADGIIGIDSLTVQGAAPGGSQYERPDSDVDNTGGWVPNGGPSALWDCLNEAVADDGDFISVDATSEHKPCTVGLTDVSDPGVDTDHIVRYRYRREPVG